MEKKNYGSLYKNVLLMVCENKLKELKNDRVINS